MTAHIQNQHYSRSETLDEYYAYFGLFSPLQILGCRLVALTSSMDQGTLYLAKIISRMYPICAWVYTNHVLMEILNCNPPIIFSILFYRHKILKM